MAVNITSRADAEAIIREQVVSTIFQDAPKQSVFMSMARKLPNMTSSDDTKPSYHKPSFMQFQCLIYCNLFYDHCPSPFYSTDTISVRF